MSDYIDDIQDPITRYRLDILLNCTWAVGQSFNLYLGGTMRPVENSKKEPHIAERLKLDSSGLLRQEILGKTKLLGIRPGCFPPQEVDLFTSGQIVEERWVDLLKCKKNTTLFCFVAPCLACKINQNGSSAPGWSGLVTIVGALATHE